MIAKYIAGSSSSSSSATTDALTPVAEAACRSNSSSGCVGNSGPNSGGSSTFCGRKRSSSDGCISISDGEQHWHQ